MTFGVVEQGALTIGAHKTPMLLVGQNTDPWGNNLAEYLGYSQPKVAITKMTRIRDVRTFAQLAPDMVSNYGNKA